jgi:hypothetical protein
MTDRKYTNEELLEEVTSSVNKVLSGVDYDAKELLVSIINSASDLLSVSPSRHVIVCVTTRDLPNRSTGFEIGMQSNAKLFEVKKILKDVVKGFK